MGTLTGLKFMGFRPASVTWSKRIPAARRRRGRAGHAAAPGLPRPRPGTGRPRLRPAPGSPRPGAAGAERTVARGQLCPLRSRKSSLRRSWHAGGRKFSAACFTNGGTRPRCGAGPGTLYPPQLVLGGGVAQSLKPHLPQGSSSSFPCPARSNLRVSEPGSIYPLPMGFAGRRSMGCSRLFAFAFWSGRGGRPRRAGRAPTLPAVSRVQQRQLPGIPERPLPASPSQTAGR